MRRIQRPSPSMIVALIALVIAIGGTAYATGEGKPLLGGARNPGNDQSKALTKETQIIASTSGYGTRQSNKSSSGGGAIYGCRSGAGGTPTKQRAVRAREQPRGGARLRARHRRRSEAGRIETKDGNGKPFTTNANGVATGLNADRVDSLDAEQIIANARTGLVPLKTFAISSRPRRTPTRRPRAPPRPRSPCCRPARSRSTPSASSTPTPRPAGRPQVFAEVYARTTQDGSLLDGQVDNLPGDPAYPQRRHRRDRPPGRHAVAHNGVRPRTS